MSGTGIEWEAPTLFLCACQFSRFSLSYNQSRRTRYYTTLDRISLLSRRIEIDTEILSSSNNPCKESVAFVLLHQHHHNVCVARSKCEFSKAISHAPLSWKDADSILIGIEVVSVGCRHILRLLTPKNDLRSRPCTPCSSRVETEGRLDTEG